MLAGDVFLILFLLLLALGFVGCYLHRRKIRIQQETFIAWAGEQLQGTRSRLNSRHDTSSVGQSDEDSIGRRRLNSSMSDVSDMSFISVDFAMEDDVLDFDLATWESKQYGIVVKYPKNWRVHNKAPGTELTSQLLVEFVVRRSEAVYMRLSIAFDDVCWSKLTPRTFSRLIVSQLPTSVPGSKVLRQGPVPESSSGTFEVLYTVPDEEDEELNILSYFCVGNTYAFTISFTVESHQYRRQERLARDLLNSFVVRPLAELRSNQVQETFEDPGRTNWSQFQCVPAPASNGGENMLQNVRLYYPAHWTREPVENPRVVRFVCGRGEKCMKMINYFIVDMSTLDVSNDMELLHDLVVFYKQEVGQQGVDLSKETFIPAGERKAGMKGRFYAFQTFSKRKFVTARSHVVVGLHRNKSKVFGHIVTVSVSEDYFAKYQKFAQFVFQKFLELNDVDKKEMEEQRQRSPSGALLSPLDFGSSSV